MVTPQEAIAREIMHYVDDNAHHMSLQERLGMFKASEIARAYTDTPQHNRS